MAETPTPFQAYRGGERYIFVCYAHDDAAVVYPELVRLRDAGFNVWFDEGIRPGLVWREELASAIERAALFLFYVSPRSVQSENCRKEVSFALDAKRAFLAVVLEPTQPGAGMRLAMSDWQALLKYRLGDDEFREKLRDSIARILDRDHGAHTATATSRGSHDTRRYAIGVIVPRSDAAPVPETTIARAIARYLSWSGAPFRAVQLDLRPMVGLASVDYVVDVVVAHQDPVQINWQLESTENGELVWANRHVESSEDFAGKQDRIAEMIGEGVVQRVSEHQLGRLEGVPPEELDYREILLKADQYRGMNRRDVEACIALLERATRLEGNPAQAHANVANMLSWKLMNGMSSDRPADANRARTFAAEALRLDSSEVSVLVSTGTAYCRLGEYDRGLGLLRRAMSYAPSVTSKDRLAMCLCFAGSSDEAVALYEEILSTMPAGHVFPYGRLAIALTAAGRFDEALTYAELAVLHFAHDFYGWVVHANILSHLGRREEAVGALRQAERLVPGLALELVIRETEASYGRTETVRDRVAGGLRLLLPAAS